MSVLPDGDGVFRERRTREVDASAEVLWSCVADLGSAPGWYAANRLWAFRHLVDGLVGGPGGAVVRTGRCAGATPWTGGGSTTCRRGAASPGARSTGCPVTPC